MTEQEDSELLHEIEHELEREAGMADSTPPEQVPQGAGITISFRQIVTILGFFMTVGGFVWAASSYLFVTKQEFAKIVSATATTLALLDKDVQKNTEEIKDKGEFLIVVVRKQSNLEKDLIRLMERMNVERGARKVEDKAFATAARKPSRKVKSRIPDILMLQVQSANPVKDITAEDGD